MTNQQQAIRSDFYVYGLFDNPYVPFYIGKGKDKRAYDHIGEARRGSHLPVHKKIRSMDDEPVVKILASGLTEDDAYELEELAIMTVGRRYDKTGPLLNLSCGGKGGRAGHIVEITPEHRAARTATLRSPEVRAKISAGVLASKRVLTEKGRKALQKANRGKKLSTETKLKISVSKTGKPGHKKTPEQCAAISKRQIGRYVSDETKRRISESVKKTCLTDEQKEKHRVAVLRIVTCPHCSKSGARSVMMRWHFDNCRNKQED